MVDNQNKTTGKKRGRKPKGGKIVNDVSTNKKIQNVKPNIILHLKCNQSDINTFKINSNITSSGSNFLNSKLNQLQYQEVLENNTNDKLTDSIPDLLY